MEKNNIGQIRTKVRIVIGCILVVLLCAAPCNALTVTVVYSGQTLNIGTGKDIPGTDYLYVYGTVNLYPGACVSQRISALSGSVINFYSGQMGENCLIQAFSSTMDPKITVYGTSFKVDDNPCEPTATFFTLAASVFPVLKGIYENGEHFSLKFYGNVPIYLVNILDPEVDIDIKPGGNPNRINLKSKGVVPVAVLGTVDFDAATIDPATVKFAGASPVHWALDDVDGDGNEDMLLHFKTQELNLTQETTEATLTGETFDGKIISGTDEVCIISSKEK